MGKPITIHDLAIHRGMKTAEDGSYSGADIAAVGLAILGGCCRCAATIAAYNAYPSKNGYWMCGDCIENEGEEGYATVEEANREIYGAPDPTTEALKEIDRLAEAGLCQTSAGGKHEFLKDIRRKVAELGIQGGLTAVQR